MTSENTSPEQVETSASPTRLQRAREFVSRDDVGNWAFLLTLIAGAIHRAWFIFYANQPKNFVWSDMQGYVERAARLADPRVHLNPYDAFYPPGAHVLMAPFFYFAKDRKAALVTCQSFWFVLAVFTLVAVGLLANRLFRRPIAAFVAVTLVWSHWAFSVYTGFFSSETPFAFFMCISLYVALWARDMRVDRHWARSGAYALAGLLAGVAAAIRPQYLFQAVIIGLPLIGWRSLSGHIKALVRKGVERPKVPVLRWREAIALGVMFALPCLGAMRLNSHAMGRPAGMGGNAGLNFYQGHCDVVHVHMEGMGFAAPVRIQRMVNEGRDAEKIVKHKRRGWDSEYFFDLGFKCIRQDGWLHLKRIGTNVLDLFATTEPWPPNQGRFRTVTTWSNTIYCYALLVIVPISMWLARKRWAERWLIVQLACVLPVGLIFYGDPRYRVPYDVFGMLLVTGIILAAAKLRRDGATFELPESEPEVSEDEPEDDAEQADSDDESSTEDHSDGVEPSAPVTPAS